MREPMFGAQPGNALGIEGDAIPRSELAELSAVEARTALCGSEVGEETLEPAWEMISSTRQGA